MREHTTSSTGCEGEKEVMCLHTMGHIRAIHAPTAVTCVNVFPYPTLSSNEVEFVHDKETDILHILPLFPPAGQHIPVLRSTDDDITLHQNRGVVENGRIIANLYVHVQY